MMDWVYDDGGRGDAGFKGLTSDCVTRSIAIAAGIPYCEVYNDLYDRALNNRAYMKRMTRRYGKKARGQASPRTGVSKLVFKPYIEGELGWTWTPTMFIGSGCQVHLRENELPMGKLIVRCSRHLTAVIDGVIHDVFDCSRDGTRCVYGVWKCD